LILQAALHPSIPTTSQWPEALVFFKFDSIQGLNNTNIMRVSTIFVTAIAFVASVAFAAPTPYAARQSVARRSMFPKGATNSHLAPRSDAKLSPSTYVILSKAPGPNGEQFAVTFNGQGHAVTTTTLSTPSSNTQEWVIADYADGKTQSITPVGYPGLQAAWGVNGVEARPSNDYAWTISKTDTVDVDEYTIQTQSGSHPFFWGREDAPEHAEVTIGMGTGNNTQKWVFQEVQPSNS